MRILFDDVRMVAMEVSSISNKHFTGFKLIGDSTCKTIARNQKLLD